MPGALDCQPRLRAQPWSAQPQRPCLNPEKDSWDGPTQTRTDNPESGAQPHSLPTPQISLPASECPKSAWSARDSLECLQNSCLRDSCTNSKCPDSYWSAQPQRLSGPTLESPGVPNPNPREFWGAQDSCGVPECPNPGTAGVPHLRDFLISRDLLDCRTPEILESAAQTLPEMPNPRDEWSAPLECCPTPETAWSA